MPLDKNEKSRHIVYVITQGSWGGAQRYVFDLAVYFSSQPGYRVSVVCGARHRGELVHRLMEYGIPVFTLNHLRRSLNPFENLLFSLELKKLLQKLAPNLVHFNSTNAGIFGPYGVYLYNRRAFSRARCVYTAHGFPFNEPGIWKKLIYIPLEFAARFFRDAIICVSDFDRASALKYHIANRGALKTIHNGIDSDSKTLLDKAEARRKLGLDLPPNAILVGTISHFYANKGLRYLVGAAALVFKQNPGFNLYFAIFGGGPEEKLLTRLITEARLADRFFIRPYVSEASKHLRAFDIIAMPSLKEGLPYFLLEAGIAGRAVVASRVGGIPEIISNHENGLLVPPKNPAALALEIIKLTNNTTTRQDLGHALWQRIEQSFSLKEMYQRTQTLYFRLLAEDSKF